MFWVWGYWVLGVFFQERLPDRLLQFHSIEKYSRLSREKPIKKKKSYWKGMQVEIVNSFLNIICYNVLCIIDDKLNDENQSNWVHQFSVFA